MSKHEQDALLDYLEFNLTSMVEQQEIKLTGKIDPEMLNQIVGDLYDGAYEVLGEMRRSLGDRMDDIKASKVA